MSLWDIFNRCPSTCIRTYDFFLILNDGQSIEPLASIGSAGQFTNPYSSGFVSANINTHLRSRCSEKRLKAANIVIFNYSTSMCLPLRSRSIWHFQDYHWRHKRDNHHWYQLVQLQHFLLQSVQCWQYHQCNFLCLFQQACFGYQPLCFCCTWYPEVGCNLYPNPDQYCQFGRQGCLRCKIRLGRKRSHIPGWFYKMSSIGRHIPLHLPLGLAFWTAWIYPKSIQIVTKKSMIDLPVMPSQNWAKNPSWHKFIFGITEQIILER